MLYNPPHFREQDRAILDDHIRRMAFATLVTEVRLYDRLFVKADPA